MRHAFAIVLTATLLSESVQAEESKLQASHPYTGMWVTDDGHVRHELLPSGRYVEARGKRERAYEGRYEVTGTHIEYWDDTGFTADGDFVDANTLHHGGMVLRRLTDRIADPSVSKR
ncbi:Atu4866 domain-containing protein [Rhizobium mongolense]|uniref:Atu4866 domain-containing protein n=1 Tax=Rhizobium TaxID=379 RepID=UPI0024B26E9B|nr:Atu4866 domain-containing protein [Rhizobium sp. CC1099]WFU88834.1 Atu4866 domain-containing protein [Rhizobium sp. CC1099]